jgi:hypothetical protein
MNNRPYTYDRSSSTFGHVIIAGLIASHGIPHNEEGTSHPAPHSVFGQDSYSLEHNSSSFDLYRNIITGQFPSQIQDWGLALSSFYTRLLTDQETLGSEFEKILHENLWILYES